MSTALSFGADGKKAGEVELAPEIFDVQVNVPVLHEVVRAQLAAARAGTHSTKTRGEVRGGGRKPWRQKGTGRARHGSIREPQWVGGGVAHGPKPRDHSVRVNRKTRVLALRSALTDRAREGKVIVIEMPQFSEPETSRAIELLEQWGAQGRTLLVAARSEEELHQAAWKSFRNLPDVETVSYPTAYTVLAAETVIFTKQALADLTAPSFKKSEAPSSSGTEAGLSPASEGDDGSAGDSRAVRGLPASESEPAAGERARDVPTEGASSDEPEAGAKRGDAE